MKTSGPCARDRFDPRRSLSGYTDKWRNADAGVPAIAAIGLTCRTGARQPATVEITNPKPRDTARMIGDRIRSPEIAA